MSAWSSIFAVAGVMSTKNMMVDFEFSFTMFCKQVVQADCRSQIISGIGAVDSEKQDHKGHQRERELEEFTDDKDQVQDLQKVVLEHMKKYPEVTQQFRDSNKTYWNVLKGKHEDVRSVKEAALFIGVSVADSKLKFVQTNYVRNSIFRRFRWRFFFGSTRD